MRLTVLIALLLLFAERAWAYEDPPLVIPKNLPSAKVIDVVDGDTLVVLLNGKTERVRLIGLAAPKSSECYSAEALESLKKTVGGKTVYLESDDSQSERDEAGRLLRHVWLPQRVSGGPPQPGLYEGELIAYAMVVSGEARAAEKPHQYRSELLEGQNTAQCGAWDEGASGLWAGCPGLQFSCDGDAAPVPASALQTPTFTIEPISVSSDGKVALKVGFRFDEEKVVYVWRDSVSPLLALRYLILNVSGPDAPYEIERVEKVIPMFSYPEDERIVKEFTYPKPLEIRLRGASGNPPKGCVNIRASLNMDRNYIRNDTGLSPLVLESAPVEVCF